MSEIQELRARVTERQRLKRERLQTDAMLSILNRVDGMEAEVTVESVRMDVPTAWEQAIRYDTPPSSVIRREEGEKRIVDWLEKQIALLGIRRSILIAVPERVILPLARVTISPARPWVESLYREVSRGETKEFDLILGNPEQTQAVVFVESEHEISAFRWTHTGNGLCLEPGSEGASEGPQEQQR